MTGTERKLDEANYFLKKLNVNDPYFDYNLSAYLNAARSTSWIMRHEFHLAPGWEDWFKGTSITHQEKNLLKRVNDLRIESTKKSGLKTDFLFMDSILPEDESYAAIAEIMKYPDGTVLEITIRTLDEPELEDVGEDAHRVKGLVKLKLDETENSRENILAQCTEYFNFLKKQVAACVAGFQIQPKEDAFRVSDRSGTPQAGNPAEEYSGERDPEALRGDTPKHNTQHS